MSLLELYFTLRRVITLLLAYCGIVARFSQHLHLFDIFLLLRLEFVQTILEIELSEIDLTL